MFDNGYHIDGIAMFGAKIIDLAGAYIVLVFRCAAGGNRTLHYLLVDCRDFAEFALICPIDGKDEVIITITDMAENGGRNAAIRQQFASFQNAAAQLRNRYADV